MNSKNCWCLLLAFALLFSCQGRRNGPEPCPVISFTQAELPDFSKYIEKMRMVWIEPVEGTLFSQPDKILVYKDKLLILDKTLKCVIGMDTSGHFLFRIQRIGKGPWEYSNLSAMWINHEKEELWLQAYVPRKILVFGLDGTPRREYPIEWSFDDMAGISEHMIAGFTSLPLADKGKELGAGLYLLGGRGEVKKALLGIGDDSWYYSLTVKRNLTEWPGGILLINQSDTIYRITPDGTVVKDFIADFGPSRLPVKHRLIPYSPELSQVMNQSDYLIGKDQILGFGPIRLFKAYLKSQLFYAYADLSQGTGCYHSLIRTREGPIPILFPECVSDQGDLVGLLNLDAMVVMRESLTEPTNDPNGKILYDKLMGILERGIRNDRPILWIAPIKKEWLTEKNVSK